MIVARTTNKQNKKYHDDIQGDLNLASKINKNSFYLT